MSITRIFGIQLLIGMLAATPAAGNNLAPPHNPNLLGINIAAPLDYSEDRLYADIMRTARDFKLGANANSTTLASLDNAGWPTTDFSFYAWADLANMHGTYALTFKGRAYVASNPGGKLTVRYDTEKNISKATIYIGNKNKSALTLSFTQSQRTADSAVGTGVTSIQLMRPTAPGSNSSYSPTTVFADPIKNLLSKFSTIRFMDFLSTNSNQQRKWQDRPLPGSPSFNRMANTGGYGWQGLGGPWEHVILLANETGHDVWINIPALADDTYVTNVANLFAYGSDGANPYTRPQKNPVYPPLNASLKLYVEYSNELWNSGPAFSQTFDNCALASEELTASNGDTPLNWDKSWNKVAYIKGGNNSKWNWSMCNRRPAKRTVEISNIFRNVFGDASMMTRVRPVLMTQFTYSSGMLFDETLMLMNYYNRLDGNHEGAPVPHPPNYYIYGAGGSAYYQPRDNTLTTTDAFFDDPGMQPQGYIGKYGPTGFRPSVQADVRYTTALGVNRIAYEGGPHLQNKVNMASFNLTSAVVNDPRMSSTIINMHNEWSLNGGDLLVYFNSTGDAQWGFTPDIYNLSTYKLNAIDALNQSERAQPEYGKLVPAVLAGSAASICSRSWKCNPLPEHELFTADGSKILWASYLFRSDSTFSWEIKLQLEKKTQEAEIALYLDGNLIGKQKVIDETVLFNTDAIKNGLHGLLVSASSGKFHLKSIEVRKRIDSPKRNNNKNN